MWIEMTGHQNRTWCLWKFLSKVFTLDTETELEGSL